jgi:hypothetical protein
VALVLISVDVVISRTAMGLFEVALYRYATTGATDGPFTETELRAGLERGKRGLFGTT